jgi:hypothetical protein
MVGHHTGLKSGVVAAAVLVTAEKSHKLCKKQQN